MFELLRTRVFSKLEESDQSTEAAGELLSPPATWVPPLGASARTWANILKNKNNIDYCTSQFHYLGTRCVEECLLMCREAPTASARPA
jgi:hypothetical protein